MAYLKVDRTEEVLTEMAGLLVKSAEHPLVNFEIQRRMSDVPGNLMELFFMERDACQIKNWHVLGPYDRFGWVGTLMRLKVPHSSIHAETSNMLKIRAPKLEITVEMRLPARFKNAGSFWKGMDDYCLLVGVCFYMAVLTVSGGEPASLFEGEVSL